MTDKRTAASVPKPCGPLCGATICTECALAYESAAVGPKLFEIERDEFGWKIRDEYVCEHGYVRCEGCEDCAAWADGWHRDHERDAEVKRHGG